MIPESHVDLLTRPLYGHLATRRTDGSLQVTPMWFLLDGDELKFTTTRSRRKFLNLEHDPHLSSRHIAVEVFHGRVSLRGSVGSEADRRRAIAAVTSVPGARGVDDDLVVDPPTLGSSLAHGTGR